jgi:hypothetical protein
MEAAEMTEKSAEFTILMSRSAMIIGPPLRVLITVGFLAGVLFAVVALGGGKPKMALLAAIVTFASFPEIPRQLLRAYLISATQQTRVETSLAALPNQLADSGISLGQYLLMRRIDPFDLWFWMLFFMGIRRAARFSPRTAIWVTAFLFLICTSVRVLEDMVELAEFHFEFGTQQ